MSEQNPAPIPAAVPKNQIKTTAVTAGGAGYLYLLADYASDCLNAHHLLPPPKAVIVMTLAVLAPFVHLIGRIIMNRLERAVGQTNGVQP